MLSLDMSKLHILFFILLLTLSSNAESTDFKENQQLYLLFGVGITDMNLDTESESTAIALGLQKSSAKEPQDKKPALKIGVGLELDENFAIESYYQYLSESTLEYDVGQSGNGNVKTNIDSSIFHIDLVGKLPINQLYDGLNFISRVGYAHQVSNASASYLGKKATVASTGNEFTYGVGFEYKNFRLEGQQFNDMSEDIRVYTLGYIYRLNL